MQRTNIRRMAYRATTTRSILDWCAMFGVLVRCYFWASLFIDLYQPSNLVHWGMILAISFLFSLVLPALLSLLVPTTPASQLLQKTRWGTVGFWFTVAVALFIGHGGYISFDSLQSTETSPIGRIALEACELHIVRLAPEY